MTRDEDMIVIGGGAAGLVAAGLSAMLGAKTTLVEANKLGGECTWTGCVPSKTLLRAAGIAHQMRTAGRYGLPAADPQVDLTKVMQRVHRTREQIYQAADAPPNLERLGVRVLSARARFIDPHTVELTEAGGQTSRLTSRYFVIATGSRPKTLSGGAPALTNETIFEVDRLPRRLLVVGAGPVGMELSQAFCRLGSDVTVVGAGPRILPRDDSELTAILQTSLEQEGVHFVLGRRVSRLEQRGAMTTATLDGGQEFTADAVLVAVGREPVVEGLGLDKAGVELADRGVRIDRRCRTSQAHVFASGDVTGWFQFTHMAEHMSKVAVANAILRLPLSLDDKRVTWCTFTDPELAHVGASERGLRLDQRQYQVYRFPFQKLDRAVTDGETTGLVKVLSTKGGKILGASILGKHAGEMIAEYALAMKNGLSLRQISDTIHPYPTYALGNRRAADSWYLEKLSPRLIRLLQMVLGHRGKISRAGGDNSS